MSAHARLLVAQSAWGVGVAFAFARMPVPCVAFMLLYLVLMTSFVRRRPR